MNTGTQLVMPENRDRQISYGFFVFLGVVIWAIITLIMRLWGHTFFIVESNLSMGASFLFSLLFLPLLVYSLFRWQKVQPHQRMTVTVCLAIPSMLLDVVTAYFFAQVYPNVLPSADGAYGAWLLWGYAIVLLTGAIASQNDKSPTVRKEPPTTA